MNIILRIFLFTMITICSGLQPMIGNTSNNSTPYLTEPKWIFDTGFSVSGSLATDNKGSIYIPTSVYASPNIKRYGYSLFCIDSETGNKKWEFKTGQEINSTPSVSSDGIVFFGSRDSKIYALNSEDGSKLWEFETGRAVVASPALSENGLVICGSWDGSVYALDSQDGSKIWDFKTHGEVSGAPSLKDGLVYVAGGMSFYCLDEENGTKIWEYLSGSFATHSPAIGEGDLVFFGSDDKKIYAFNRYDGTKLWDYETIGRIYTSITVGKNNSLFFASQYRDESNSYEENAIVYSIDGNTGQLIWELNLDNYIKSTPGLTEDGNLIFGGNDGSIYVVEQNTGEVIFKLTLSDINLSEAQLKKIWSSPLISDDGTIYIANLNGRVFALDGKSSPADSSWPLFKQNPQRTSKEIPKSNQWLFYKHYPWVYDNVTKDWLYLKGASDGKIYAYRASTKAWESF